LGSEVDEALDSDLEEARGKRKKSSGGSPTKQKKQKKPADSDDDDDDDDEDESPKKKKAPAKKKKDVNAPKRGMTAYFLFANKNRDRFKKENPDAPVTEIVRCVNSIRVRVVFMENSFV
jgi:HMG (high mobility group) box